MLILHDLVLFSLSLSLEHIERLYPHVIIFLLLAGEGDVVGHGLDLEHKLPLVDCLIYLENLGIYCREKVLGDLILSVIVIKKSYVG